jgi:hypothetical protein
MGYLVGYYHVFNFPAERDFVKSIPGKISNYNRSIASNGIHCKGSSILPVEDALDDSLFATALF